MLGTGGASKAVGYVLGELGIPFDSVSRDSNKCRFTYGTLTADAVSDRRLIVNATPLGTYPATEGYPPILTRESPRTLSVRSGLQSAAHGISAEGSRTGRRNAQRLRHARRASRTGMGNLERETVTAPDREAAMRFSRSKFRKRRIPRNALHLLYDERMECVFAAVSVHAMKSSEPESSVSETRRIRRPLVQKTERKSAECRKPTEIK